MSRTSSWEGDAGAVGDGLGGDEARECLRVLLHAGRCQHHAAPAGKGVEQLLHQVCHPALTPSLLTSQSNRATWRFAGIKHPCKLLPA